MSVASSTPPPPHLLRVNPEGDLLLPLEFLQTSYFGGQEEKVSRNPEGLRPLWKIWSSDHVWKQLRRYWPHISASRPQTLTVNGLFLYVLVLIMTLSSSQFSVCLSSIHTVHLCAAFSPSYIIHTLLVQLSGALWVSVSCPSAHSMRETGNRTAKSSGMSPSRETSSATATLN